MNTLSIPVTNHNANCFVQYNVDYKRADEAEFTRLSPAPTDATILIPDLMPGDYNIRIQRLCCNGSTSNTLMINYTI